MSKKSRPPEPHEIVHAVLKDAEADVWYDPNGETYVSVNQGGHREHLAVYGDSFVAFLTVGYLKKSREYTNHGLSPSDATIRSAQNLLRARALERRVEHETHVRVAHFSREEYRAIYYDLGDDQRRVVEIDAEGFRIITSSQVPVRFVRPSGMSSAPVPSLEENGQAFELLRDLFLLDEEQAALVTAFVLACADPSRIYPILVLQGMQGSGKSTLAEYVGRLVDPRSVPLMMLPSNEKDLVIAAMESHALVFDNASGVSPSMSDALCRMSTGGGFVTRKLYTNRGVERFSKTAPVVINGIESMTARNDLADRAVEVHLKPIGKNRDKSFKLRKLFDEAHPRLLGAWFASLSEALAVNDSVELDWKPRMMDFASWTKAASGALPFTYKQFKEAYIKSINRSAESNVESDRVASGVVDLVYKQKLWQGSMTELRDALAENDHSLRFTQPRRITADLDRATPALGRLGYSVKRLGKITGSRRSIYRIERIE